MPRIARKSKPITIRLTIEGARLLKLLSDMKNKDKVAIIDDAIRDMAEKEAIPRN